MSKQRRLILDIISSSQEHMTADEIYLQAKKLHPSIAVGTVYRNLNILSESRKIRKIHMPNSADRYDRSLKPHDHLVCEKCGKISDIVLTDFNDYVKQHTNTEIIGYDLTIKHICDDCKKI